MLTLIVTEKGGTPKRMDFDKDEVTVGRVPGNDIVLNKGNVSKRHSRVVKQDGRFFVVDLKSTNGTYLNGRRITTPSVIRPGDKVYIGDFVVMVDMGDGSAMEMAAQDMGDMPMDVGAGDVEAADNQDDAGYDDQPQEQQGPPPGYSPPAMAPRPAAMTSPGPVGPGGPPGIQPRGPMQPPQGAPRPMQGQGAPGPMSGPSMGGPPMGGPPMGGPPMGGPPMGGPSMSGPPMGGPPMGGPSMSGPPMGGPSMSGPPMGGPPMGGPNLGGPGGPPRPAPLPSGNPMGGPGGPPGPSPLGPSPLGPSPLGPSPLGGVGGPRPLGPAPSGPGPMPMQGAPSPMQGGPGPMPGAMQGGPGPMPGGPAMRASAPNIAPAGRAPAPMPQHGGNEGPSAPMGGPHLVPAPLGGAQGMDMSPPDSQREVMPSMDGYSSPETPPLQQGAPMAQSPMGAPRPLAPMPMPPQQMEAPPMQQMPQASPAPAPMAPQGGPARPIAPAPMPGPARAAQATGPIAEARSGDEYADLLAQVIRAARQRGADGSAGDDAARARIRPIVDQAARSVAQLPAGVTHERLARDAVAEIVGVGAYEALFEDPEISAATVDHQGRVTTQRAGVWQSGSHWFSSPSAAADATERFLRGHGVDRAGRASVHAALADGTRVFALFPPLSHAGVVVQIDRSARSLSLADMGARGLLPPQAVSVLTNALAQRRNIIVAGARGSGRSTVLAALLTSLPQGDRAVVIEDCDELSRSRRDVLSVRADGDWTAAVHAALALRAGRVVYGEGYEACARAFVTSLTTGAEGAMIAVAAPTGPVALARLASTSTQDKWLTQQDAAARILAARPLVIETARLGDGQCRVVGVGEVRPGNDGSLQVAAMFVLRIDGTDAAGNLAVQLVPAGGY